VATTSVAPRSGPRAAPATAPATAPPTAPVPVVRPDETPAAPSSEPPTAARVEAPALAARVEAPAPAARVEAPAPAASLPVSGAGDAMTPPPATAPATPAARATPATAGPAGRATPPSDEPASEPAAPQAPDDPTTLAALRDQWPEIVAYISQHPPTKPLISACRPIAVDGATVTLGFPEGQAFLKDVAERRRSVLEDNISAVLGRSVGVRCVATNIDVVPELPSTDEAAWILAEARRIFGDDAADAAEVG